jgi:hypothetical protein
MDNQFDAAKIRLADGTIGYDAVKLAAIPTEGIYLKGSEKFPRNIPQNCDVIVNTRNSTYTLQIRGDEIHGICQRQDGRDDHNYLPALTKLEIPGSTWGGSMMKLGYIGVGMHIEAYPENGKCFTTSPVEGMMIKPLTV